MHLGPRPENMFWINFIAVWPSTLLFSREIVKRKIFYESDDGKFLFYEINIFSVLRIFPPQQSLPSWECLARERMFCIFQSSTTNTCTWARKIQSSHCRRYRIFT
jgi:hypothetical protein